MKYVIVCSTWCPEALDRYTYSLSVSGVMLMGMWRTGVLLCLVGSLYLPQTTGKWQGHLVCIQSHANPVTLSLLNGFLVTIYWSETVYITTFPPIQYTTRRLIL